MRESRAAIADEKIWLNVKERWKRGESALKIVDSYKAKKEGSIFQINKILLASARGYEAAYWISDCERIGLNRAKKGCKTKTILRLINHYGQPHPGYRFNEKDVDFLRKMAGDVVKPNDRYYETRTFCGVLHQELERVKKDADVDSLFLDKQFLSECVEDLDSCHDAPIIDEVKKRAETKKRIRLQRAMRAKKK